MDDVYSCAVIPQGKGVKKMPSFSSSLENAIHSALAFANDRKACFDAGMDNFLAKPVKKADLLLKLAELSAEMAANRL